jgi:hypothetical protein
MSLTGTGSDVGESPRKFSKRAVFLIVRFSKQYWQNRSVVIKSSKYLGRNANNMAIYAVPTFRIQTISRSIFVPSIK